MHHANAVCRRRRAAQPFRVSVRVSRCSRGVGPFVHMRVGVKDTIVTVRMSVKVAAGPAKQQPEGEDHDHHADRYLGRPRQGRGKMPGEDHYRQPKRN